jgi:predicted MPP superfamily phosphohydrolase
MSLWKNILRCVCLVGIVFSVTGIVLLATNTDRLITTDYTYTSAKYHGKDFKLVQLSDFHNHSLDYSNGDLISAIDAANPDAVVITGDMIDNHTDNYSMLFTMAEHFKSKAYPFYYVDGNHERKAPSVITEREYTIFNQAGGHYLYQSKVTLAQGLTLSGLRDPYLKSESPIYFGRFEGDIPEQIAHLASSYDEEACNLLLCHRPEYFDLAKKAGYDVMLSGHTHGGQISFGNWNVALYPWEAYQKGRYDEEGHSLIVSNGLGYSYSLPMRHNCDCQLVSLTIKSGD